MDSLPTKKSNKPFGWGKRHTFSILGFSGFAISYAIRFNISIAIVAMVNSTGLSNKPNVQVVPTIGHDSCPLPFPSTTVNGNHYDEGVTNKTMSPITLTTLREEGEFNWNEELQGYILGSFFWGYILTQLPGGILSYHFGSKWCFGLGIFIPGILALLTPISARLGPGWIMALRVGQGLGGGITVPSAHGLVAKWIPPNELGILSTAIYAGMPFGSGITMVVSGYLSHYFGWETVFYTTGLVVIIWFGLWSLLVHERPSSHPTICKDELLYIESGIGLHNNEGKFSTPWKEIWTSLPFWAILIGHASETWALYTLMIELPTYLKTVLHFDMTENSWISAFPYFITWIFSLFISFLGRFFIERKLTSVETIRKIANSIALWGSAASMIGVAFSGCDHIITVCLLTTALAALGGFYSGANCNHIDISPRFASILMGITNTAASSPGFAAPLVAGYFLKGNPSLDQWRKVFLLGAGIAFTGNLFYVIFGKGKVQKWNAALPKREQKN